MKNRTIAADNSASARLDNAATKKAAIVSGSWLGQPRAARNASSRMAVATDRRTISFVAWSTTGGSVSAHQSAALALGRRLHHYCRSQSVELELKVLEPCRR